MLHRPVIVCALSAILCGSPWLTALADGYSGGSLKDAPPPPEPYVWSGAYVGVGIGIGSLDRSVNVDANARKQVEERECEYAYELLSLDALVYEPCSYGAWAPLGPAMTKSFGTQFGDDDWNGFGTIQIGYDRLIHDRILLGGFADFDFYPDAEPLKNVWSIGGRLGFLVTPRILLFGVGGYTEARLDAGAVNVVFGGPSGPTSLALASPDELQGWFVGGGAELMLRSNVSLKIEYRYSDFGGESAWASGGSTSGPTCLNMYYCSVQQRVTTMYNAHADYDADMHSVRLAIALKLGDHEDRRVAPLK